MRAGQLIFNKLLYPGAGNDIGTMLFAGMQLDRRFAIKIASNTLKNPFQPVGGKFPGKIYNGFIPCAFAVWNIMLSA